MDEINELKRKLGAAVLAARERLGMTQAEVAAQVGIAPAVYGRIERGQMLPSVPTLRQICVALHVPADVLMAFDPVERTTEPSVREEDPPELRRLANALRGLSPASIRVLTAIASVINR